MYWVAECDGQTIASVSIVKEWSNFRGGHYWWIQSVFIIPEHRGTGLIHLLIDRVTSVAQAACALDLRLYAHSSNERGLASLSTLWLHDRSVRADDEAPVT